MRTDKKSEDSGRGKWIAGSTILVLLVAAGGYAMYPGQDPAVARIEALREQLDGASGDQRRELFRQMRDEYEKLPEATREQLRAERDSRRELEDQKRMSKFFAMSPQEQIKALDESIKREEQWRKEREQRRGRGGDAGRGGGDAGRGAGDGGRGNRGGRGSRGDSLGGDPNARRKAYLDSTSPQGRAMRGEYYRMRAERRQQLGLASR